MKTRCARVTFMGVTSRPQVAHSRAGKGNFVLAAPDMRAAQRAHASLSQAARRGPRPQALTPPTRRRASTGCLQVTGRLLRVQRGSSAYRAAARRAAPPPTGPPAGRLLRPKGGSSAHRTAPPPTERLLRPQGGSSAHRAVIRPHGGFSAPQGVSSAHRAAPPPMGSSSSHRAAPPPTSAIFTQVGWCARRSEIPGIVAGVDRGDERLDSDLTRTAIKADTQLGKWTLSWHAHCDAAFAAGRHHASGARSIVCLGAPVWASQEAAFPATEGGASPGYLACTTNAGNASGVFGGRRGVRLGRHAILS